MRLHCLSIQACFVSNSLFRRCCFINIYDEKLVWGLKKAGSVSIHVCLKRELDLHLGADQK